MARVEATPGISSAIFTTLPGDEFWPSRVTIKTYPEAHSDSGQLSKQWADLPGHISLQCRVGPYIKDRPHDREMPYAGMTVHTKQRHVLLRGYFPNIAEKMAAVVDGEWFNISGIDSDGNHVLTRLRIEQVKPGATQLR